MTVRKLLAAFAALAIPLAPLGVYAAADIPISGALPHGGTYVLYRDQTIAAAAVDLWFRAPAAGYGTAAPGIGRLAATAAAAATLESGKSLYAFVRSVGGRLTINVYPDIIGVSAMVPASAARRTIAAMSAAFFSPSIDAQALKIARQDAAVLTVARTYSSDDVLHDALFASIFSGGPAHYAPLPDTVSALTSVTLDDVRSFARRAFRSANATLSLAGNVDPAEIGAVTAGTPGSPDAPLHSDVASDPKSTTISGNVGGIGIAWTGPPIGDEKAATAMDFIADYLFRDQTGVVAKTIPATSSAYLSGQFITLHDPGVMLVTIGGAAPDALRKQILDAVAELATPLDAKTFAAARNAFLYHLGVDTQQPVQQADNLGWYSVEGNASYAPTDPNSTYWQAAESLDPGYVASIAKRYLSHPVVIQLNAVHSKESAS
ncbi:MAG TPA: insulinase family protein [Candidatus Aquilonibacter sp.]|nr:insulinase family protein [Candidatus Aquilonibacter sp.]